MGLVLAFIGIFPSILLIRLYFQTKITDYLLFGLFFIFGILVLIFDPLAGVTDLLIFYQLHHFCIDTDFFILFIHACRMAWKKIPRPVLASGVIYYLVLVTMTLLWHKFEAPNLQPDNAVVIFFYLPHTFSTYFPNGAGLTFNNVIIYSTGFRYIGEFFRFFSLGFLFYAYYFKTKDIIKDADPKIRKARNIWLSIWIMFLLHTISLFPWTEFSLLGLFLILAGILIFYITFFLPEGLLLSSVQVTRILPLYGFIRKQVEDHPNPVIENISNYLEVLSRENFHEKK